MRVQCFLCPWRKEVSPHDIPNGYSEALHCALRTTIADGVVLSGPLTIMACHESKPGHEKHCVGWLHNQLGPGNNILLRIQVMAGHIDARYKLVGEQHERFEDTLPSDA